MDYCVDIIKMGFLYINGCKLCITQYVRGGLIIILRLLYGRCEVVEYIIMVWPRGNEM